jgi:hypothetical protein
LGALCYAASLRECFYTTHYTPRLEM